MPEEKVAGLIEMAVKQAIESASHDSYEAVLVVIVLLTLVALLVWTQFRLAKRVTKLEDFQTTTLLGVVEKNSVALANTTEALKDNTSAIRDLQNHMSVQDQDLRALIVKMGERPCLLPEGNKSGRPV
jgi:hypothetical protein